MYLRGGICNWGVQGRDKGSVLGRSHNWMLIAVIYRNGKLRKRLSKRRRFWKASVVSCVENKDTEVGVLGRKVRIRRSECVDEISRRGFRRRFEGNDP
jgi:hypothetical protein